MIWTIILIILSRNWCRFLAMHHRQVILLLDGNYSFSRFVVLGMIIEVVPLSQG